MSSGTSVAGSSVAHSSVAFSGWADLAASNTPADAAARAMNCNLGTAIKRLEQARAALAFTTLEQAAAVALLTHSGIAKPAMGRGSWTDVVLGLKRAV